VVARIPGVGTSAAPELAQEVVLLSAHYDHLGVRKSPKKERPDDICNGADDDASGCAALLELAQAVARGPKPARTLVILFTTAEESGGFGSRRYIAAPAAPLARTVANLNLEMLGRPDELAGGAGKLWLTGFQRSNLGAELAAKGLAIVADPRPQENFFTRSDNYAFALEGVVAQTLSSFALHPEYHTPRDEADTLDYAHLEAAAKVALEAARLLADGSLRPAWHDGKAPEKRSAKSGAPKTEEELAAEREKRRVEREQFKARRGEKGAEKAGEEDGDPK
jgi:Zn-dependent M28 family amino/carboxypeptidase